MFDKGEVPLPDRLMSREAIVARDVLSLDLDGNRFRKVDGGVYEVSLGDEASVGCRLRFTLDKPVIRHGDDGVVRGLDGEQHVLLLLAALPRRRRACSSTARGNAVAGDGWYDHEFGERDGEGGSHADAKVAWNWVAAQLDNGCEISAYTLVDKIDRSRSHGRWVIVVDADGGRRSYTDFTFEPYGSWTSTKTFNEYPTGFQLDVEEAGISLDVKAAFPAQEVITLVSAPAFWEGLVEISGVFDGQPVSGRGFVERSGASVVDTTDEFLSSVGRETRRAIDALLPEHPTAEEALRLIGGPGRAYFMDGVDLEQYSRTVLGPIREIVLRGGKAWRSYGALSCIDLVGGDSRAVPRTGWRCPSCCTSARSSSTTCRTIGGAPRRAELPPDVRRAARDQRRLRSATSWRTFRSRSRGCPTASARRSTNRTSRRCARRTPARRSTSTASRT